MTEFTMAQRIKHKDEKAFQLLESILLRPGMYVGTSRFDYIHHLFDGYCWGRDNGVRFLSSEELQYWILHTQSASLCGSIAGVSLFYRCFGFRELAFENYKKFLDASLPIELRGTDLELHDFENKHNLIYYEWNIENPAPENHDENMARAVGENIKTIISKNDIFYDEIKVYIRRERFFIQVRFLYHGNNGWIDDSNIISKRQSHEILLAMHANARNATVESLRDCGYEVNDYALDKSDAHPSYAMTTEDFAYASEFERWKEKYINAQE